jgi:hypothetical protein
LVETDNESYEIRVPWVDQSQLMIDEFSHVLLGKGSSSFDYRRDLLSQARVMEAIRISHAENRFVKMDEIKDYED